MSNAVSRPSVLLQTPLRESHPIESTIAKHAHVFFIELKQNGRVVAFKAKTGIAVVVAAKGGFFWLPAPG